MDGWINGWMDGWTNWWMDGWINGWMDVYWNVWGFCYDDHSLDLKVIGLVLLETLAYILLDNINVSLKLLYFLLHVLSLVLI